MASKSKRPLTPEELRVAANLKAARSRSGKTLDDVASLFGISNQAVSQWENASTRLTSARIPKILEIYDMSYDELIGDSAPFHGEQIVSPSLLPKAIEDPTPDFLNELDANVAPDFDGLRIEGEVAAGRWIEVHADIEGELAYHDIYDKVPVALDHRWPKEAQYGLIVRGTSVNNVAVDGDVLTCVSIHNTGYRPREQDLVIVEQRRDAGLLVERTAKRWVELESEYELWPDSSDPRWQAPLVIPKNVGFDRESDDGILVTVKAFVTWVHRPVQVPVRRRR